MIALHEQCDQTPMQYREGEKSAEGIWDGQPRRGSVWGRVACRPAAAAARHHPANSSFFFFFFSCCSSRIRAFLALQQAGGAHREGEGRA